MSDRKATNYNPRGKYERRILQILPLVKKAFGPYPKDWIVDAGIYIGSSVRADGNLVTVTTVRVYMHRGSEIEAVATKQYGDPDDRTIEAALDTLEDELIKEAKNKSPFTHE